MKLVLGLKAHSGWAALVALGQADGDLHVVDRRIDLVATANATWARQPYPRCRALPRPAGTALVERGIDAAALTGRLTTLGKSIGAPWARTRRMQRSLP